MKTTRVYWGCICFQKSCLKMLCWLAFPMLTGTGTSPTCSVQSARNPMHSIPTPSLLLELIHERLFMSTTAAVKAAMSTATKGSKYLGGIFVHCCAILNLEKGTGYPCRLMGFGFWV